MYKRLFITFFTITVLLFITSFKSVAQNGNNNIDNSAQIKEEKKVNPGYNFIKVNLTAIVLKNYSFQYERVLNKSISIALSYKIMPATTLPFQSSILKLVGDEDAETKKTIEDLRLSSSVITPEIRFYLGKKGFGRGFYIAPFYRHSTFKTSALDIFYSDSADAQSNIKLSGKLSANTGGLLFGVQHAFGKHIVLDTWIFGPHYGSGKGDFIGTSSQPLTKGQQSDLRDRLNSIADMS
jgi:hypothetical protein